LGGAFVPRDVAWEDQRGRADAIVVGGARFVWSLAPFGQRRDGFEHAPPHGDYREIGAAQVLVGAIEDLAHAFLDRQVFFANTANARVGAAAALQRAIDQVIVGLVAHGLKAGIDLGVHAQPRLDLG